MLELPESTAMARQVNENLIGKVIEDIELLHSPHRFTFLKMEAEGYEQNLVGQEITGAVSHGGTLEIDTEEHMMAFADGAYPRFYDAGAKEPKKHQCAIHFEDGTALYVSVQMYGEIFFYPKGKCTNEYYLSSSTKPNPLTDDFTYDYFAGLLAPIEKQISVKAFLATEQRIPGLGNGVLQDILWDAGMDPRCKVCEEDLPVLYKSIRKILGQMVAAGGRDTEKLLFGDKGGYVTQLSKNSLNQPCMRCGYEIHKANYMGGTIYFCEHCQRRD